MILSKSCILGSIPWYYFIDIFLIRFGDSKHTGYNTEFMVNGFFEYIQYRNELFGLVLN